MNFRSCNFRICNSRTCSLLKSTYILGLCKHKSGKNSNDLRQHTNKKSGVWRMSFQQKKIMPGPNQGCQMVCFQTKNPKLGKNFGASDWKMLIYFMAIWNILWIFGIFYDHLVHFVFIWYIFPVLV
jgi:hypothetical protein